MMHPRINLSQCEVDMANASRKFVFFLCLTLLMAATPFVSTFIIRLTFVPFFAGMLGKV